ncbi:hypothetical protein BASA60_007914 [Batrachochytrium salamandrivorans]|nr:hypothetical protein BASA60_007914 [Batrachochytrium salamandrivorans]
MALTITNDYMSHAIDFETIPQPISLAHCYIVAFGHWSRHYHNQVSKSQWHYSTAQLQPGLYVPDFNVNPVSKGRLEEVDVTNDTIDRDTNTVV